MARFGGLMFRRSLTAIAALAVATVSGLGCTTANDEDLGAAEAAATPAEPAGQFGLAQSCARLFKRHESVRPIDLQQGVIRWGCGDVPGVTDPDLGQEYCEYQAVQNGRIVKKASDLGSGPVTCVFTSVFTGAGQASSLKSAMADSANLGVAAAEDQTVQMRRSFNTRGAAITLVSDCSRRGSNLTTRLRAAACYQAWARGGANASQLEPICRGTLSDQTWAQAEALGAKVYAAGEEGYEAQRDIAGCMAVKGAGVGWRNSDPMICSRVSRSTSECSCQFSSVPSSVIGFPFTGWVDDQMPSSCRLAKVSGAPYPYIALCTLSDQEVSDLPLNPQYSRAISNFCHDRFGVDLVLKLPLRALQAGGSCNNSPGFCAEYMGTSDLESAPDEPLPDDNRRTDR
jgi:hypothetical protein